MDPNLNIIRATVRAIDGEFALVEVEHGCGRCQEKGGCGGQHLTQMFCSAPKRYKVENRIGALAGEHVRVAVEDGAVRTSANLAYGFPILGLLIGGVAGQVLAGDPGAIGGALAGMLFVFVLVRRRLVHRPEIGASNPHIISRV